MELAIVTLLNHLMIAIALRASSQDFNNIEIISLWDQGP